MQGISNHACLSTSPIRSDKGRDYYMCCKCGKEHLTLLTMQMDRMRLTESGQRNRPLSLSGLMQRGCGSISVANVLQRNVITFPHLKFSLECTIVVGPSKIRQAVLTPTAILMSSSAMPAWVVTNHQFQEKARLESRCCGGWQIVCVKSAWNSFTNIIKERSFI